MSKQFPTENIYIYFESKCRKKTPRILSGYQGKRFFHIYNGLSKIGGIVILYFVINYNIKATSIVK